MAAAIWPVAAWYSVPIFTRAVVKAPAAATPTLVIEDHKEEKPIKAFPISWEAWALCALDSSAKYWAISSGVPVTLIPAVVINNSI